jgi:TonB family protein
MPFGGCRGSLSSRDLEFALNVECCLIETTMQVSVKYLLRFGIAGWLICSALSAEQGYASTEPRQQPSTSPAVTQSPSQSTETPGRPGGVDLLSDTKGVDVGPYLESVLKIVRQNWYRLMPRSARAPKTEQGEVSIEIAILRTGKVKGMRLVGSSVDASLGAAAWHAIGDSRLPPLPAEYSGQYLALRLHFYYNPSKANDTIPQYRD